VAGLVTGALNSFPNLAGFVPGLRESDVKEPSSTIQEAIVVPLPTPPSTIIDTMLRVAMVAGLIYACYLIILPFASIVLWSVILAVMFFPLHNWLRKKPGMGNRRSAALIALLGAALLLVPMLVAADSIVRSTYALVENVRAGTLALPTLPARVASLPFIGDKIAGFWAELTVSVPATVEKFGPEIKEAGLWLGKVLGDIAGGTIAFIVSILIAGIILAYADTAAAIALRVFERATADAVRGARLARLATATTRAVATGVIGVAFIQAVLVGIGLFVGGVPAAGALSLGALLLGIVQVPVVLITLPAIAYVWATQSVTFATIFTIWTIAAGMSDTVLKPLLLGRGLEVPMPVILIGVIGGTISGGLVGLFTGPIMLAVGYMLFIDWIERSPAPTAV
jgi:predicted PurR-regulated permease PerM